MNGPSDAYFEILNRLLPKCAAMGGYRVGLVSALAWNDGLDPDEQLMHAAAISSGVEGCLVIYERWKQLQAEKEGDDETKP